MNRLRSLQITATLSLLIHLTIVSTKEVHSQLCGHSHVLANLTSLNVQHFQHVGATQFIRKRSKRNGQSSNTEVPQGGMRIHVDYQLEEHDQATQAFIKHQLVPAAVAVIESSVQVKRPIEGNLQLPRYCISYYASYPEFCIETQPSKDMDKARWALCGHARHNDAFFESYDNCRVKVPGRPSAGFDCEQHVAPGVEDSDLILYVTAIESQYCEYAAAYALYCSLDLDTNRPLAGSINFCPSSLSTDPDSFDHQVEVAVHELLHTLVFSESLYDKFIDAKGEPIPLADVVQTSFEGDRLVKKIVTPTVVAKAREHFQCPTLNGAELEDEGGPGTAGSHWESRTFQGELMDGMSGVNIVSDRHAFSPLTLALLEDSGWYTVDWDTAGSLEWGKDAGCSFAQDSCDVYMSQNPDQHWFCKNPGVNGCTSDLHAYGQCQTDILLNHCNIVLPFTNMDCKQREHHQKGSVDWGARHGSSAYCLALETPMVHRERKHGKIIQTTRTARTGDCYNMDCKRDGSYYIDMLGQRVPCDYGRQKVSLRDEFEQFASGAVECPERDLICMTSGCPNGCSGQGWCHDKKCYCHLGFTGDDCSMRICSKGATYCICSLYKDKDYGRCFPGSENVGQIQEANQLRFATEEHVYFSFEIEEASLATIRSAVPRAVSASIGLVDSSDVRILGIEQHTVDHPPELELPPDIIYEVKLSISTIVPSITRSKIEDAVFSGDLSDALENFDLHFIDGSLNILGSDRNVAASGFGEDGDSVEVARRVMIIVAGLGSFVFVLIAGCSMCCIWRRIQSMPFPTNTYISANPNGMNQAHYLSTNYHPNPFTSRF